MTSEFMRDLLSKDEKITVEYKTCQFGIQEDVYETVCSFSNRYGGYIIMGTEDDGTPIGVKQNMVKDMKRDVYKRQGIYQASFIKIQENGIVKTDAFKNYITYFDSRPYMNSVVDSVSNCLLYTSIVVQSSKGYDIIYLFRVIIKPSGQSLT